MSYLTPDSTKAITARKLGDDFDKTAVFAAFVRNAKQVRTKTPLVHSAPTIRESVNQQDNDSTSFLNIINEFYVKDSSKKVKAVMNQKGESWEYLTTNPPYGYMKDPENIIILFY